MAMSGDSEMVSLFPVRSTPSFSSMHQQLQEHTAKTPPPRKNDAHPAPQPRITPLHIPAHHEHPFRANVNTNSGLT